MEDTQVLKQIKDEYNLGYEYMKTPREKYRKLLLKRLPQNKSADKININLIANTIDTLIASFFSNGVKVKFISKQWWIWQEEADNLNSVAEFDKKESTQQQVEYQIEQDSLFFGVGILNRVGWDWNKMLNKRRAINPLSWIPDPLPSQTGQFDWQNYRFHWFSMSTTAYDMKNKYDNTKVNEYFRNQYDTEEQINKDTYASKNWYGAVTCDNLDKNFSLDIYTHYTIVDWYKRKFVTDPKFSVIFTKEKLEPTLKEEKLEPLLVPRPIMLNYYDPQRMNPLGWSLCDKLEDKQNALSILYNLNLIKSKKEALWGDFLVNSRLIKNKAELEKKSTNTRYLFVDEEAIWNNPIQNAMYELPQSQIKQDTFTMANVIQAEANKDSKIDNLQSGIAPDKTMTKAEAQQIQANANNILSLKNAIKSWFYQEMYFQRWRWYLENMEDGKKKFILLNSNYERTGTELSKDEFVTKQIPYIMVGSNDDIMALNEQQKAYLNQLYPIITNDPTMNQTSKNIFKRLSYKINGMQNNIINTIVPYSASEQQAKDYVDILNMWAMPKSIFTNPNADFITYWIYIQKAEDSENKSKVLNVLKQYLMDQWEQWQMQAMQNNPVANSAANIMMSQTTVPDTVESRPSGNEAIPQ